MFCLVEYRKGKRRHDSSSLRFGQHVLVHKIHTIEIRIDLNGLWTVNCAALIQHRSYNDDVLRPFETALSHWWWWHGTYWPSTKTSTASHFNSSSGHTSFDWRNWINGFWWAVITASTIANCQNVLTICDWFKLNKISCIAQFTTSAGDVDGCGAAVDAATAAM